MNIYDLHTLSIGWESKVKVSTPEPPNIVSLHSNLGAPKPSSVVDPRCFARAPPFAWASVSEAATVYADAQPGNAIPRILADAGVSKLLLVQRNQLVHSENHVCDEHQTASFNSIMRKGGHALPPDWSTGYSSCTTGTSSLFPITPLGSSTADLLGVGRDVTVVLSTSSG